MTLRTWDSFTAIFTSSLPLLIVASPANLAVCIPMLLITLATA